MKQDSLVLDFALTFGQCCLSLELQFEGKKDKEISLSGQDGQRQLPPGEHLLCAKHLPLNLSVPGDKHPHS